MRERPRAGTRPRPDARATRRAPAGSTQQDTGARTPNEDSAREESSLGIGNAPVWWAVAIIAAGIVTYGGALGHPLLFDDYDAIVNNPTIRTLGDGLRGAAAQYPTAGRPLVNVSFALNYLAGGDAPWGYHAVNLSLHVACGLLVFGLLRRLLHTPRGAALAGDAGTPVAGVVAVLWVLHPLNSEVVNYATQRTEVLMALAFLGTLYCGLRALTAARAQPWQVASVALCAAGMLCKESMVTAPFMMLALDATVIAGGLGTALRRRPMYYAALAATLVPLAAVVVEGPRWRSAGFTSGVSPWTYLLNQAEMIVRYLHLAVWPTGLVLDYGQPVPRTIGDVWPQALIVLILLGCALALWMRRPLTAFFATWFFVTLAPSSSFVPIATEVGAERRMYLPLVALLSLVVMGGTRVLSSVHSSGARRMVGTTVFALAAVALSALSLQRGREYQTGVGLWQTVLERRPHGRAHYNLGIELKRAGRRSEAIEAYRQAAVTEPGAHYALGFELDADGRRDAAVEEYRTFIRLSPQDVSVPRAYHQVGRALMALGRTEEAAVAFRDALARKPGDLDSTAGLGDALLALEHWNDAVGAYADFLKRKPADIPTRFNMGLALARLDRDAEARDAFAEVVRLEPSNVAAHVNLGFALANTGRLSDSVVVFRRALELEKDPAGRQEIQGALAQLLGTH